MSHSPEAKPAAPPAPPAPKRELTLFDSTCIIVGIIVGATIYEKRAADRQYGQQRRG